MVKLIRLFFQQSWRKKLAIISSFLLIIIALLAVGIGLYVRSDNFNRFVIAQIQANAPLYGLRAEIEGFGFSLREGQANLKKIKLFNGKTEQLLVEVEQVNLVAKVLDPYALKLNRKIVLETVDLSGVNLFIELKSDGSSNFSDLKTPPSSNEPSAIELDYSKLIATITNSNISLKDPTNSLSVELKSLDLISRLKGLTQTDLDLSIKGGSAVYQDYNATIESINLKAEVDEKGLRLAPSEIITNLGSLKLNGQLDDWKKLQHQINIALETKSLKIPNLELPGLTKFDGQLAGNIDVSRLTGQLTASEILVPKTKLTGVTIDNIELVTAPELELKTGQIKTQIVISNPLIANSVIVPSVSVKLLPSNISLNLPQLLVGTLAIPKGQLRDIKLTQVDLNIVQDQITTKVKQTNVSNLSIDKARLSGIRLNDTVATVQNDKYQITSDLFLANGQAEKLEIGQTTGKLGIDNNKATLSSLKTNLLGGEADLELELALTNNNKSNLQTKFRQIDSFELVKLGKEGQSLPVNGLISGDANLSWPGTNFLKVTGELKAIAEGQASKDLNQLPLTANLQVLANQGNLTIKPLIAKLGEINLTAQAEFSPQNNLLKAEYKIDTKNSEELLVLAKNLKLLDQNLLDLKPNLTGDLQAIGQINGQLDKLTVESDIEVGQLGFQENKFKDLSGKLKLNPDEVSFVIYKLFDSQGGFMQLDFQQKVNDKNSGQIKADFTNFYVQFYQPNTTQELFAGQINGRVELSQLAEKPLGIAELNLKNSRLATQPTESVDIQISLANQIAKINNLSLKLPAGIINTQGSVNLQTNDFQLVSQTTQLDLSKLNIENPLQGKVNAIVSLNGNPKDLSQLQLDLQAESDNLKTIDTQLGRLSIQAWSDNQGHIRSEITSYLIASQPQKIFASLTLNKEGYPLEIESELNKLDVALLLAAIQPQAAKNDAIHSSITGKLNFKGKILNDKGEFNLVNFEGGLNLSNASFKLAEQTLNIETPTNIDFEAGKLCLDRLRIFSGDSDFNIAGQLALMDKNNLDFTAKGIINLKDFNSLVPNTLLNGSILLDAKLTGTPEKPQLVGQMMLNKIGLSQDDLPIQFTNGNGLIVFGSERILLDNFSIKANDGQVNTKGRVDLTAFQPNKFQADLVINNVNLIYQGASLTVGGDLALSGTPTDQLIKGNIKVLEASYLKPFDTNTFNTKINSADEGIGTKSLFSPRLDINVDADSSIVVQNPQINTVASATLSLTGKIDNPNLIGRINLEGGSVIFRKERYDITEGILDLPGGVLLPNVNLLAEGEVNTYRVFIRFSGPIDQIDLELESEPVLTRTEILTLITTGRPDATGGEQQDLATTGLNTGANLLAQEFISKPFGRKAEQLLGLNQFQIDPIIRANENPSARLTLGRQIIPKLSFTYSTSLASSNDQAIILEYNLSNRFSSLFSFTQGGNSTRGNTSDSDLAFEIRGRERFSFGGKGQVEKTTNLGIISFKPLLIATAEVIVDKPEGIKIGNDTLRDLLPIQRQPFSIPLAKAGQENLTNYLQEQGYFFAKVNTSCDPVDCQGPGLKVKYEILPGERYEIRKITLSGTNLIDTSSVIGQLQTKEKNFFGKVPIFKSLPLIGGFAYGVTSNERLRQDSEFIRQQLIDLGYRQAKVSYDYKIESDGQGIDINFTAEEGALNRIGEILLQGTNAFEKGDLVQAISLKVGEPFTPNRPREVARELQDYYAQRGYLDTTIEVELEQLPNNDIRLIYQVNEGEPAEVAEVIIQGTLRANEGPIRRFIDLKPGDLITNKKLQKLRKDLYATGNFREIQITLEPLASEPSLRRVLLKLTEAKPLLLIYGFGFSTDDGPRGSIELSNTDFFNRVTTSAIRLRLSKREQRVQLQFTDLRPFGSRWATTASMLYNRVSPLGGSSQQISNVDQAGLSENTNIGLSRFASFVQSERRFTDKLSFRVRYNFELAKLINLEDAQFSAFTETSRITRLAILTTGASYDTRDNPINPTRGNLFSIDYSLATRILGGNESFNKINTSYQYFNTLENSPIKFLNSSILAFSSRIGLAAPFQIRSRRGDGVITDSDTLLPFSERFRSGGSTTLRGFLFETAGPQAISEVGNAPAQLIPLGGNALAVFNLELRYPLTDRLQLVPFYDLGNVFSRVRDIDFKGMANTVGVGLRFNTPIGPIGVDYGYLLDPQTFITPNGGVLKQRRGVLHIKFGQSF